MRNVLSARSAVLTLLALLLVGGAQVTRPAPTAAAPTEGPCRSHVISVDRSGMLSALTVLDGRVIAGYTQEPGRGLPFEVRSMTTIDDETIGGFQPTGGSAHLALSTRGDLYQVSLGWDHQKRTVAVRGAMLLNTSFDGFRQIVFSVHREQLYGVHQDGRLYRYTVGEFYQPLRGTVVGTGWSGISQVVSAPLNFSANGISGDTLVAVQSRTGQLIAYSFDEKRPRVVATAVIGQRGWAPMLLAEDRCSRSSVIAIHRTTRDATLYRAADVDAPWTSVRAVRHVASRWWSLPVASA